MEIAEDLDVMEIAEDLKEQEITADLKGIGNHCGSQRKEITADLKGANRKSLRISCCSTSWLRHALSTLLEALAHRPCVKR
jgi:hypothetical protein